MKSEFTGRVDGSVNCGTLRRLYAVGGTTEYLLPAAAARRPAVAGGGGANKVAAAIGGVIGMFNHHPVLRRHQLTKLFDRKNKFFRYFIITARSELRKVLFFGAIMCLWFFCLCMKYLWNR